MSILNTSKFCTAFIHGRKRSITAQISAPETCLTVIGGWHHNPAQNQ